MRRCAGQNAIEDGTSTSSGYRHHLFEMEFRARCSVANRHANTCEASGLSSATSTRASAHGELLIALSSILITESVDQRISKVWLQLERSAIAPRTRVGSLEVAYQDSNDPWEEPSLANGFAVEPRMPATTSRSAWSLRFWHKAIADSVGFRRIQPRVGQRIVELRVRSACDTRADVQGDTRISSSVFAIHRRMWPSSCPVSSCVSSAENVAALAEPTASCLGA